MIFSCLQLIGLVTLNFFVLNLNDTEHCVFLIFRIEPVTEFNNFCTVHSCATEPP